MFDLHCYLPVLYQLPPAMQGITYQTASNLACLYLSYYPSSGLLGIQRMEA